MVYIICIDSKCLRKSRVKIFKRWYLFMRKNLSVLRKFAFLFMALGGLHVSTFSIVLGFHEPDITSLLEEGMDDK